MILNIKEIRFVQREVNNTIVTYGLFALSDSNSDSHSKPNGYIALCRYFHIARSQIQIPILTANYRNGIEIRVHPAMRHNGDESFFDLRKCSTEQNNCGLVNKPDAEIRHDDDHIVSYNRIS